MPLYEYKCGACGLRFEELKGSSAESSKTPCRKCSGMAVKQISSFSHVVVGGSSVEPIDLTIGREANKRWQNLHDRQAGRRKGQDLKSFDLPKTKDGKYTPVMALGQKAEVENRKEYVTALQEHRKQRQEKGTSQFSESGVF